MNQASMEKPVLIETAPAFAATTEFESETDAAAIRARAAIRRCDSAWKRSFQACMKAVARAKERESSMTEEELRIELEKKSTGSEVLDNLYDLLKGQEEVFAAHEANEAYRRAMPVLAGYENVCDFIACVAHGILIGAFQEGDSTRLLYAAQIALSTAGKIGKQRKGASSQS